jgi:hypothetical protein
MMDEVLTRAQAQRAFIEIRTACIATPAGYRYATGMGEAFLQHLHSLLVHAVAPDRVLLLITDCARWIRRFFTEQLASIEDWSLLLDWYHLRVRCIVARYSIVAIYYVDLWVGADGQWRTRPGQLYGTVRKQVCVAGALRCCRPGTFAR